jgi:hypothetical protein
MLTSEAAAWFICVPVDSLQRNPTGGIKGEKENSERES